MKTENPRPKTSQGYALWIRITTGRAGWREAVNGWLSGHIEIWQIIDARRRCRVLEGLRGARTPEARELAQARVRELYASLAADLKREDKP
jgi:hypothetical protein